MKDREDGLYYDRYFERAISAVTAQSAGTELVPISITSFNEWHEGTQIEPCSATPPVREGNGRSLRYSTYHPLPSDYYLSRTRYWVNKMRGSKKEKKENRTYI